MWGWQSRPWRVAERGVCLAGLGVGDGRLVECLWLSVAASAFCLQSLCLCCSVLHSAGGGGARASWRRPAEGLGLLGDGRRGGAVGVSPLLLFAGGSLSRSAMGVSPGAGLPLCWLGVLPLGLALEGCAPASFWRASIRFLRRRVTASPQSAASASTRRIHPSQVRSKSNLSPALGAWPLLHIG